MLPKHLMTVTGHRRYSIRDFMVLSSSKRSFIPARSYEEIYGTITPADATRVVRPYYDYSIPFKYNPHYPEFRQGKLR